MFTIGNANKLIEDFSMKSHSLEVFDRSLKALQRVRQEKVSEFRLILQK